MSKHSKNPDDELIEKIEALKMKAKELGIESLELDDDTPAEVEHSFWADLLTFETTEALPVMDTLMASGLDLPPPFRLSDEAIPETLWRMIHGLSFAGAFLHHTDHLTDRELYTQLWQDHLRRPAVLLPARPSFGYHIDMVEGLTEQEDHFRLRYYADDEEREIWATEHPQSNLPPAEEPPNRRDERLPRQPANIPPGPVQ